MDATAFRIDGLIIDPAHIITIDLDAQVDGFGYTVENAVRITLAVVSGEFGAIDGNSGSWEAKALTYTGPQAEVLRPWLAEMFPCCNRSIKLPGGSSIESEAVNLTCALSTCTVHVDYNGEFCSLKCHELYFANPCVLDTCNVRVGRKGNFCSDECAELFEEQISF